MAEALIRLERPAHLTPELRAWIGRRVGTRRVVLSRGPVNGSARSALVLRVELESERDATDEVAELVADLQVLGLRPTLVAEQAA